MAEMLVIGGGISGLSAAYELAKAGVNITLLEARCLGAMASTWTLGGVRQSGRDPAELPLAIASVARWHQLDAELGAATGYRQHGNLRLARTPAEIATLRSMVAAQRALGLDLSLIESTADLRRIAPAIGQAVLAASFCPGDGHADPDMTIAAYAAACRRLGVTISEGTTVRRLLRAGNRVIGAETDHGRHLADRVIVAAGIQSPDLIAGVGLSLPLAAKRVMVMQTVPVAPCFDQVFGVANADCAGRQEISGRFRYTTGIGDWNGNVDRWTEAGLRPTADEMEVLTARVRPLLPVAADAVVERSWGGLIDLTPDALPVLDAPEECPGLVIGAGFSGHGFGIGPVTGEILRDLALGTASRFALAPFRLARLSPAAAFAPLSLHG